MRKPKFNLGNKVYHITPESEVGVILDIVYHFNADKFRYVVGLGFEREV